MSQDNIAPFANASQKRANDVLIERMKGVAANETGGNPNMAAIENLLAALEGMQTQVTALTDLVIEQDKRIQRLEKAKSNIIKVRN